MQKVKVGQITSPIGIKGEVRVFSYMDEITRFFDFEKIYVGESLDRHYTPEKIRFDKGLAVIKFKEVPDRNTSETMRGLNLYVSKDEYELSEDSYYLEDLLGCTVVSDEGKELGILKNVIQNSSQDVYEIEKKNHKSFLVPAVHEFVKDVDVENKKIVLHLIEGLTDEV